MELTREQMQAIKGGEPVRVPAPEIGTDCVVIRADLFDRVRAVLDDGLNAEQVAALVERTMQEYDADDPLLDSYQKYRP